MKKVLLFLGVFISVLGFSQKNTFAVLNDFMIELPGKWIHTKDNSGSQFGFENKKLGGFFTVSIREAKKIEFYKSEFSNYSEFELLNEFFKWDFDYWKENPRNEVYELNKNEGNKTIIWKAMPQQVVKSSFNYRLDGIQNGYIISISYINEKMDEQQKIDLLKNIYSNIKYTKN